MNKYKNFSIEDFLQDEFFNQWVKDPTSTDSKSWEIWLESNPDMWTVVQEAKKIICDFAYQPAIITEDFYSDLKKRIDSTLNREYKKKNQIRLIPLWLKIAAVFSGVIVIALFYYSSGKKDFITISSKYAETKNIVLPDGSKVTLNANSSIKYADNWNTEHREVWLKGEGFFKIKHAEIAGKAPVKFIVHASEVNVEVVGTQFNINSKDDRKTKVLLTSGKIRLSVIQNNGKAVNMSPDDLFDYDSETKIYSVTKVKPDTYVSWIDHKYIFEKAPLEEVCKELQRYYGKEVMITDEKIRKQHLSGILELQNEETLIQTLSALLGVPVQEHKNQIIIYSK